MPRRKKRKPASSDKGYVFDEDAAQKAVDFFSECLHHIKGEWAGKAFVLDPWQRDDVIRPLFGWKRPDGTRRYRTVYVEVPRKNGKSTLAAGIGAYLTFADGEPGAEVYSAAADRDQAAIVFEVAKAMVEAEPELASRADIYRRSIVVSSTGSSYKVLSADAPTKHGLNAHGIIFDELHAQPTRDLYDVLITSTGARRQPVVFFITTAGYDRHSICWELHDYACKVRDGVIHDPSFLPVIYAAGADDDYTKLATWKKANPSLGRTVKADYLAGECERAKEIPAYENTFRRLHLDQWTEQAERWIPLTLWDQNAGPVDRGALRGKPCYAGLDLSTTTDLSALVLVFPEDEGYSVLPFFWVPGDRLRERVRRDRVPYDVWERQDLIEVTDGNVIDYEIIQARLRALGSEFDIREVAYDPWNASQLVTQLQGEGVPMVEMRQGFASLAAPTKALMTELLGQKIRHGGHPVLRWMANNVAVRQDPAGNLKPDKARSADRIDGIVALIMALGRAQANLIPIGFGVEFV